MCIRDRCSSRAGDCYRLLFWGRNCRGIEPFPLPPPLCTQNVAPGQVVVIACCRMVCDHIRCGTYDIYLKECLVPQRQRDDCPDYQPIPSTEGRKTTLPLVVGSVIVIVSAVVILFSLTTTTYSASTCIAVCTRYITLHTSLFVWYMRVCNAAWRGVCVCVCVCA